MSSVTKSSQFLTVFILMVIGYYIGHFVQHMRGMAVEYRCNFEHMHETYNSNGRELSRADGLVLVWQGPRRFMFRRDNITGCEEVTR